VRRASDTLGVIALLISLATWQRPMIQFKAIMAK
jgi:hypothetical protein